MVMNRSVVLALAILGAACNKPSEESCRKAISNMRTLLNTDSAALNSDVEGDIRRCRGGSSRDAVECAANAKSLDDLRHCKFMKVPDKKPETPAGSGAPPAGSAAAPPAGSAAPEGSAAPPAGSAAPPAGSG
jgi:hypothetical protein